MKKYERYINTVLVFAAAYATEHSTEPKHLLSSIGIMVDKDKEAASARDLVLAFKKDDFDENGFIDTIDWLNEDDSKPEDEDICQSEEPVETLYHNYRIGDPIIIKDSYCNNACERLGFFAGTCHHNNESSTLVAVAFDYIDLDNSDKFKYYKLENIEPLNNDYIKDHRSIFGDMPNNIERSCAAGDIVLIKNPNSIWLGYFNGPLSDSMYVVIAISNRVGKTYYHRIEDKYMYEPLGVSLNKQIVHFIHNVDELTALLKEDTENFHVGDPVLITYDDFTMLGIFDGVNKTQHGYFNITVEPTPFDKGLNRKTNTVVHSSKVSLLNDEYINTLIEEAQDRCGIGSIVLVKTEDFTFLGYYNGIEPILSNAVEFLYNVVPTDDLIGKTYNSITHLPVGSPYKAKYVTFVKDLETLKSLI